MRERDRERDAKPELQFKFNARLVQLICASYRFLLFRFVLVAADRIVCDVERVILGRYIWIVATFNHKRVRFPAHHIYLGYEQSIDVPGDAPANVS